MHHKSSFFFSWEVDCFSFKNGPNRNLYVEYSRTYGFSRMRGLGRFRNSQQAFAQGVKISRPFAFLAVRHMAICGKIVDYISGHKQFDVASAISNFKKILSKNISPFGTVKTESENIWICWRWLYKKQQNKEHKQDAALLIGVNLLQQYHIRKY